MEPVFRRGIMLGFDAGGLDIPPFALSLSEGFPSLAAEEKERASTSSARTVLSFRVT